MRERGEAGRKSDGKNTWHMSWGLLTPEEKQKGQAR